VSQPSAYPPKLGTPEATTVVAIAGRPNTGKTTLFNVLTGLNQRVANFAGCTVERAVGSLENSEVPIEIVDLPGTHSLAAVSQDEKIAFRFLEETSHGGLHVLCVAEASNLSGDLALALGLKERGYSVSVAINMMDEARQNGIHIDAARLSKELRLPVFPVSARYREGTAELESFIKGLKTEALPKPRPILSELSGLLAEAQNASLERAQEAIGRCVSSDQKGVLSTISRSMRIDRRLFNPVIGPLLLIATLFLVFEAMFSLGRPLSDFLSMLFAQASNSLRGFLPGEFLSSLVCDGILAGISAVATFVPQIAILFILIGFLEQSGYLPRAGAMLDRAFRPFGLDGKVFIPFLSSFACAIPGVMAARTIADEKRRLAAIFLCPLMTCSARIPVYTLIIAAFVPASLRIYGVGAQALVMAGMYAFGILMALLFALALKAGSLHEEPPLPLTVLPPYRIPHLRELAIYVWIRSSHFLRKAGSIIFTISLGLWVLAAFPKNPQSLPLKAEIARLSRNGASASESRELIDSLQAKANALDAETSLLCRIGKAVEPVFRPIGYDWRISVAVIASLAAREVFVGTLGTLLAIGENTSASGGLVEALRHARAPDGTAAYGLPTAVSLLIFFAIALQCVSTIIIVRRETGGWKWPAIQFTSFFAVAYCLAWTGFHLTSWLIR
jgi:ferrous iron transport protein B